MILYTVEVINGTDLEGLVCASTEKEDAFQYNPVSCNAECVHIKVWSDGVMVDEVVMTRE